MFKSLLENYQVSKQAKVLVYILKKNCFKINIKKTTHGNQKTDWP